VPHKLPAGGEGKEKGEKERGREKWEKIPPFLKS